MQLTTFREVHLSLKKFTITVSTTAGTQEVPKYAATFRNNKSDFSNNVHVNLTSLHLYM